MTITRLLTRAAAMLLLALLSTTSWAELVQDAEGYYLIGTDAEWTEFANGISGGAIAVNAKAKLTADITASTMIGTGNKKYAGTFDGQGYTITANITGTTGYEAPFNYIQGATIKNLTVEGTINGAIHCSSLVGGAYGTNSINNIKITATITTTGSHCGGVVGHGFTSNTTIRDCLFSGTINGRSAGSTIGAIWGWSDGATANIFSCLENGSYTNCATTFNPISQGGGTRNISATYYVNAKTGGNAYGLLATSEQLTSGEITYKLQSNRGDLVWGQTIATQNLPKLHLFDNTALRVYRTIDGYSNNPEEALLSQDSDGYFLIGTSDDWRSLAMLVDEMEQGVNAKMTADIDLGDAQVMVGDGYYPNAQYRRPFRGIFDGQGHTLTIHYVTESIAAGYTDAGLAVPGYLGCAPFGYVWNGTIRNLHTAGTITSTHEGVAGIVGWTNGVVLIENCHSSVDITYTNGARGMAGITYNNYHDNHNLTIQDCIYDGILTAGTTKTGAAGFVVSRASGNVYIKNSLLAATFANGLGSGDCATFVRNNFGSGYISNSHFKTALGTIQGNQATADELASGRTAFYLQNGRTELVWGQEIGVDPLPVLTNDESKHVYRSATGYTNDPTQAIPDQSLQPFVYTRNANNELTITGFDPGFTPPANYTLVIPDEIDGNLVVYIADNAFNSKTNFTSLTIGRNVKTIGSYAFTNCTAMTSISLPADGALETINQCAFENCSNLVSIVLPNTVKTLGVNVLKSCTNLTSVTISNQLATIPNETFRNCTHLNNVVIPSSVTTINNNVFWDCDALTSITIPNSVTALGTNVFRSCGELSSVTFEEGCQLTTIPNEAFRECSSLTGITIPLSITTIGSSAFNGSALTSITFPSNVTRINNSAFASCANLTEVTIPSTITTVESYAFQSCGLESANVYCHTIGAHMFYNCTELENITISDGIETISDNAFQNCSKLTSISIPSSVTTINSAAFAGCTLLANVTMADGINITSLPQYLFSGDSHLTSFTIPTSVTTIGQCAFENCTLLDNMVIPNSVTTLGNYVFKGCTNLESVTISNQVTTLPFEAFRNCTHLNNVTIPSSVTTINNNAFYDCDALTSITIPNSVTTIGTSVFQSCGLLAEVTFEDGCQLTSIPNNTFYQCSSLTGITIPMSVKTIGNSAFRYCTSLNNVVLHGGLTSIQDWSFANCTAMENLTIEEGVTSINRDVFQYSGMRNVVLPSTLSIIGINLFYQCNSLETLDVSKCVNVWELYAYTSLRGSNTIFYGVPSSTKIILPPYAQATLGANDEVATLEFDLTQDGEGFYLINNATDWEKFVVFSRNNPTINGRLTADISLTAGNARLGIGNFDNTTQNLAYQGAFDGQRHTITVDFNFPNRAECLFMWVNNASIYRLKVAGTIRTQAVHTGGIIRSALGSITIEDCESAVNIIGTPTTVTNLHMGGFIGHGHNAQIYMTDCLFTGSITGIAKHRYASAFLGWMESAGRITYNYCLNNGTFTNLEVSNTYALGITQSNGQTTVAVCYYRPNNVTNNETLATAVSSDQLTSGQTTYRLQGGREEQHWGQIIGTDPAPRLTNAEGTRVYRGQTYTNEFVEYTGLQTDSEGYYLISSTVDWEEFALLTKDLPLSNARMTNDVTVVDNTMIGDVTTPYSGIFDGQGYTLTINYDRTGLAYSQSMDYGAAPFLYIQNATIKNLHVDGSIHTSTKFAAGVVGDVQGTQSLIEKCRSSVNITSSVNGEGCMGGVVSHMTNGHTVFIRDCHFDGSFDAPNAWGNGGIMGYKNGTATIENCFFAPSALSSGSNYSYCIMRQGGGTTTINNCYYTQQLGSVQGTAATTEQLADGTIAYKLQANRTDMVWGQRIGTDPKPVLTNDESYRVYKSINGGYTNDATQAYEGLQQDADGNYLIGSVLDWQEFAALVNGGTTTANAKMTADIDLAGDDDNQWTPIGTDANKYNGTFDGQGFTIKNLYYKQQVEGVGLFGFANSGAYIKNVRVEGTVDNSTNGAGAGNGGTQTCAGGIIGKSYEATVLNCSFSGNVISYSNVGGLVGWGTATIVNCYNEGTVMFHSTANQTGGGVHGYGGSPQLKNCYNVGSVINNGSTSYAIGSLSVSGSVSNSYSRSGCVQNGSGASWDNLGITGTVMSLEDMKSEAFVTTLNTNIASLRTTYPDISEWTQDPITNLPVLKIFSSLTQDENGYYLLGSVQDWKNFAELVNTTPTANAKMTADIDLGDDQTMVGTYAVKYQGTFDGQGHTLTINYNTSSMTIESPQQYLGAAPFRDIQNATIRNLHTAGTVTADKIGATGLVGWAYGENTIERCWSSVDIVSSNNTADTFSGFVFRQDGSLLTMNDCYYSGMIQSERKWSHAGFVGHHTTGTAILNNCLVIFADGTDVPASTQPGTKCYTFVRDQDQGKIITLNNCYYKTAFGTPQGTQATIQQLANGTTAAALQAGRSEIVWVQDPVTNQPMLALFANTISFNGDGSEDNPFIITTTAELDYLASMVNSGENYHGMYFKLGADIAYDPNVLTIDNNGDGVNDSNYIPIGTGVFYYYNTPILPSFRGIFDGDGHTISGIRIYREGNTSDDCYQGVFGFIQDFGPGDSFYAGIYNLWVADVDITGWINIGGIVGRNDNCIIENCHVASNVYIRANNQDDVCRLGGIVGYNETHGTVTRCSSAVTIIPSNNNSYYNFGGLAGYNEGTLTNNLVIGATIPAVNHPDHNYFYGAIAGSRKLNYSSLQHNYYSACTVGGVPNATNVGCGPLISENNGVCSDLYDNNGAVPGYLHNVTGYGNSTESDHWALIASPITTVGGIAPTAVGNLIADPATDYDLYRFNQSASKEWENYKNPTHTAGFVLENGKGYLYANKKNVTLAFAGTINTANEMPVALTYENGVEFAGYNLVGNPFTEEASIDMSYYKMNAAGDDIEAEMSSVAIPAFTGVIVQATTSGQHVTFTKCGGAKSGAKSEKQGSLQLMLSKDGTVHDKAIVSFDEGTLLGKYFFNETHAKLYIPQGSEDYAIAFSEKTGEMPLNFKATKSGEYTLSFNTEGVKLAYLHLIDNLTGADVNLLQTPSYIFEGKANDYASRFRLVFSTGNAAEDSFAFFNGSNWVINNEGRATLQVIDIMGRVISTETINGDANVNVNEAANVYMLRLINGDNVKVQKVVVR